MAYRPPKDIWAVKKKLKLDEPLTADDPKYTELGEGRGHFSLNPLLKDLGVRPKDLVLVSPPENEFFLFCGHRGCGKSTELKQLARKLHKNNLFFVVEMDTTVALDTNNLQYTDVLMGLAKTLLEKLAENRISMKDAYLKDLNDWFFQRIEKQVASKDFSTAVQAGVEAGSGIPLIGKVFAKITNSFKDNSSYKDELRRVIQNNFSEFSQIFNRLIEDSEREIVKNQRGRKLLFMVDGTDRLRGEDSLRFFVHDAHQLQTIRANFIYCGPIHMLYEGNQVQHIFKPYVLPMIKLYEKEGARHDAGFRVLEELILRRADKSLFDSPETLQRVIEFSGGNPRECLRILRDAFSYSETEQFDEAAVSQAIHALSMTYKRFLEPDDYRILFTIDHDGQPDWETERENFLLLNLALLEYNGNYWRRGHPAVRELDEYRQLEQSSS